MYGGDGKGVIGGIAPAPGAGSVQGQWRPVVVIWRLRRQLHHLSRRKTTAILAYEGI
jgi:hypothetical protein